VTKELLQAKLAAAKARVERETKMATKAQLIKRLRAVTRWTEKLKGKKGVQFSGPDRTTADTPAAGVATAVATAAGKLGMPWDIKRGGAEHDLLEAGPRARCELQVAASRMTHFAPNCATLSRARDKPPKGATRWPPRLRSNLHPRGLPQLWTTPTRKGEGERVEKDNCMVDWAIEECIKAAKEGRGFSLESPLRAYLWLFPRAVELEEMEGTIDIDYTACMFSPGTRRKKQRLRTNRKGLVAALSR